MKQKLILWVASVLVAGTSGFLAGLHKNGAQSPKFISGVQAQERLEVPSRAAVCAAGLLQGAYSFTAQGVGPSSDEHYATVGIIVFDGQGKLSLSNTQSINGRIVFPTPIAGIYAMNEVCGGRITLTTGSLFDIVVSNNGREINLIQINSGNVVTGVARKL